MNLPVREIPAICRPHLLRTVAVALVVGTILCAINQLDVLLAGRVTGITWLKIALTYLVPFLVANYGIVSASRHSRPG
jgi:putative exporter of polyketide antibiotics